MTDRRGWLGALALVILGWPLAAAAQQVHKLTITAGHPNAFLWVKTLDEVFIPEVDRRLAGSAHRIEWTRAFGGTLIKLGGESKGVADGVADLGLISTVFEAARFPLQNVSYFTPFGSDDIGLVSATVAELQKSVPGMGEVWTKAGLVYLSGMALDTYHVWSKFPIAKYEDLAGKKLAAPGPAANWIRGTGAVPVAGTLNTYYEDIKSGVSDGALVFTTGAYAAKLHEVAPYITKVNFGSMFSGGMAVNKGRYDRLPPEVQKALREAGEVWSAAYARAQTAAMSSALAAMVAAGAKVSELPEAERKRWADALAPVAKAWAADSQGKGLPANEVLNAWLAALAKGGAKLPRDWSR
jgi:TRAP-type C4-dicarboxylate transport system substrate-binding protein